MNIGVLSGPMDLPPWRPALTPEHGSITNGDLP